MTEDDETIVKRYQVDRMINQAIKEHEADKADVFVLKSDYRYDMREVDSKLQSIADDIDDRLKPLERAFEQRRKDKRTIILMVVSAMVTPVLTILGWLLANARPFGGN